MRTPPDLFEADTPARVEYLTNWRVLITHPSGDAEHPALVAAVARLKAKGYTVLTVRPDAETA